MYIKGERVLELYMLSVSIVHRLLTKLYNLPDACLAIFSLIYLKMQHRKVLIFDVLFHQKTNVR